VLFRLDEALRLSFENAVRPAGSRVEIKPAAITGPDGICKNMAGQAVFATALWGSTVEAVEQIRFILFFDFFPSLV